METLWYVGLSDQSPQNLIDILSTAPALDANYPIRTSVQKQGVEKTPPLLLGGVPKTRREWEVKAGDDSRRVRRRDSCTGHISLTPILVMRFGTTWSVRS